MAEHADASLAGRANAPSTTADPPPLSVASASRLRDLIAALGQLDHILSLPADRDAAEPLLFGRYELTRRLGEGRFGVAVLGRDPASGRAVVVKVPQPSTLADPGWMARMSWEGRAAARLDHPGIVPLFEVGTADGLPYLVTAYVAGPTLSEWVERAGGRMRPGDAARVVRAVALAVHHAHGRGVLHCDLKPGNILIDPGGAGPGSVPGVGTPRVTDFGLARLLDELCDGLTRVAGTLAYMAPEQAAGDRGAFSARTDVYALGGVLRDLLDGVTPDPIEAALGARAARPAQPPPADLGAIARKCLAPAPADRYGSAQELADDLGHFLEGRPTSARPLGAARSLWRWACREPLAAAGALLGLLLVFTVPAAVGRYSARLSTAEAQARAAGGHAALSDFYADLERLRQRRAEPRPGWARASLAEIRRLAAVAPASPAAAREALRTEAVAALTAVDLEPVRDVGVGFQTHSLAYAPGGEAVALGEWVGRGGRVRVKLADPAGARADVDLGFAADPAWERRRGRADGVRAVAFSPDGQHLAVGSRSGHIVVWDRADLTRTPATWPAHCDDEAEARDARVGALAYSADSRRLYSASTHVVRGWDAATRECVLTRRNATFPAAPHLPGDGAILDATAPGGELRRFDSLGGAIGDAVDRVAFDAVIALVPAGGLALTFEASPRPPGLTDLRHGGFRAPVLSPHPGGGPKRVSSAAFLCGAGYCLAAEEHEHRVQIWDVAAGRLVIDRPHPEGSLCLAADPTGDRVAVAETDRVSIYELTGASARPVAVGPWQSIAAFAARGGEVVTLAAISIGSHDLAHWAGGRSAVTRFPMSHSRIPVAALAPGGPVSAADMPGHLACQLTPGGPARRDITALTTGPDGRVWALDADELRAYTLPGWRPEPPVALPQVDVGYRAVAVGRTWGVAGRNDGALVGFDPRTGEPDLPAAGPETIASVAVAPGELAALVGGEFGRAWTVSRHSGAARDWAAHDGAVRGVAHWDGLLVTGGADGAVHFWTAPGESLMTWRPGSVRQMCCDGDWLYALIDGERGVRRFDLARLRRELAELGLGY